MAYSQKDKKSNEVWTLLLGTRKKSLLTISVREGVSFSAVAKTEDIGGEWRELKERLDILYDCCYTMYNENGKTLTYNRNTHQSNNDMVGITRR